MTAAATRTFPVPRTYQTWLRDLAPVHPRRFWFSHLLVHRVEALVAVARTCPLDTFPLALLRRLFVSPSTTVAPASLEGLHFDRQFAVPLLRELAAAGLVGVDGNGWTTTEAGRQVMQSGSYTRRAEERRVFYFVDHPGAAPTYLPLTRSAGPTADVGDSWSFAPAVLRECIARPAEWKMRTGFPTDVEAVVAEPADAWRRVILDRAEYAPLLFIETGVEGQTTLTGYLVACDHWTLQREPPAVMLGDGWQEVLPDFAEALAPEAWRSAWLAWCQARQLSAEEAAACKIEYEGCKVQVKAAPAFVERLRGLLRNEIPRGETWLTLGTGRTRAAACVEMRAQE